MAQSVARDGSVTVDGRRIGYAEYGDPAGRPVFYYNGHNHGRHVPIDESTLDGVRLISVDRPGVGGSDPRPVLSFAGQVADLNGLADALTIERYHVVGWSMGSAHAMAAAALAPERVLGIGLTGVCAPWYRPGAFTGVHKRYRQMGTMGNLSRKPVLGGIVRAMMRSVITKTAADAGKVLDQQTTNDADVETIGSHREELIHSIQETTATQGARGVAADALLFCGTWDFDIAAIGATTPVLMWTGEHDAICPHSAEYVRTLVPTAIEERVAGAGHFLLLDNWRMVLQRVVASG